MKAEPGLIKDMNLSFNEPLIAKICYNSCTTRV